MPTTERLSDVMALPLVNSTNASACDCEIAKAFTDTEVIRKKELEDEQKKWKVAEDQITELRKEPEDVQQKLRINEGQAEKI